MSTPLRLAVVGHTNTGKTSLLRTLTRNPHFGEVADAPSTTRHVEGAALLVDGTPHVMLFDTPGLESASDLLDYLDHLQATQGRQDGPDQIQRFLSTSAASTDYEQEAKVLRQLLASDAALYVIDAREAILGKYQDELTILNLCGKPLLPVLNFVGHLNDIEKNGDAENEKNGDVPRFKNGDVPRFCGEQVVAQPATVGPQNRGTSPFLNRGTSPFFSWRRALARLGLHVVVEFDTVAPALDGESQLYERLGTLLEGHAGTLRRLARDREQQRQIRHEAAVRVMAELLIDAAARRLSAPREQLQATIHALQQEIRRHESAAIGELLSLFGFDPNTVTPADLPPGTPRLDSDLFQPEVLKALGIQVGVGAASGAAAGAAVDVLTGGLSLGMGTVVGATVGGLWQSAESLGQRLLGRVRGWQEVTIDDAVLAALAIRLNGLIAALEQRGHAALLPVKLEGAPPSGWQRAPLPGPLREARGKPHWSRLDRNFDDEPRRHHAVLRLCADLDNRWQLPAPGSGAAEAPTRSKPG